MKQLSLKKFVSAMLSGLLVLLGFSACSSDDPGEMPLMYGTLTPGFETKGKVVEKHNTEQGIKGIRVVAYPFSEGKELIEIADTVFTNEEGTFIFDSSHYLYYKVILEDVDGGENGGTFKKANVDIDMQKMAAEDVEYNQERRKYQYNITVEMEKETDTSQ